MAGKLIVVVGGQFGSEGKGHVCGWLAKNEDCGVLVRTGGSNAGHTAHSGGVEWKLRHVSAGFVTQPKASVFLAADSEVDPEVLHDELLALANGGYNISRIWVDHEATLVLDKHREMEQELVGRIGSTGKGIGAARADRVMRSALRAQDWGARDPLRMRLTHVEGRVRKALVEGETVLFEGSQGFGLGLHAGWYPKCTSRNCRAIDVMAGVGISPWETCVAKTDVWVVLRTYPIRVAGDSGALRGETDWDSIGVAPEHTTVTHKVRRVGEWDTALARAGVVANGGRAANIALTMMDYVAPEVRGLSEWPKDVALQGTLLKLMGEYERNLEGARIGLIGTSPTTMIDVRHVQR